MAERDFVPKGPRFKDLTGKRFGRLVALRASEQRESKRHHRRIQWFCRCDCGAEILKSSRHLLSGHTRSCGCLHSERTSAAAKRTHTKHGMRKSSEYSAWQSMRQRCMNPRMIQYRDYGGRGIEVCARWLESFENFIEDMGRKPTPRHSMDRIDPDGPYSPENCRWATPVVQARNQRLNRLVTFQGKTMSVAAWARRVRLPTRLLCKRLADGWSPGKAITTPGS